MDPATMATVLKAAADAKRALDTAALRREVQHIKTAVDAIGMQLDENVLIQVRSGFSHLSAAVETADEDLRRDELGHARKYFARLANRSGGGTVTGTSGSLSGDEVCALGYLGNFHYFLIRGEPRQALIAAYHCTERFPAIGIQLFPPQLFSGDYREAVRRSDARGEELTWVYQQARAKRRGYGLDMAWRVPAAAGAVLAGLAGATVSPPLAGHGVQWAMGIMAGKDDGLLPPPRPNGQALREHAAEVKRLLARTSSEARERRLSLER
jgi:hypothetical protein